VRARCMESHFWWCYRRVEVCIHYMMLHLAHFWLANFPPGIKSQPEQTVLVCVLLTKPEFFLTFFFKFAVL